MPTQKFNFSNRQLFIGVAVMAGLLAATMRFGPHVIWIMSEHPDPAWSPITVSKLGSAVVDERVTRCQVGSYAFQLPTLMSSDLTIQRNAAFGRVNLVFTDGSRYMVLNLTPMNGFEMFPEGRRVFDSKVSDAALLRKIVATNSREFSFGMSRRELRQFQWRVSRQGHVPSSIEALEYYHGPRLVTNLLWLGPVAQVQWETVKGDWKGSVTFTGVSKHDAWVRQFARTFNVTGEPSVAATASDAQIMSMVSCEPIEPGSVQQN